MSHKVIAHIDLDALKNNLQHIKQRVVNCQILAMVKRNAYNHGAVPIAAALQSEVSVFGVASLDEALELYHNNIVKPILILMGFCEVEELLLINRCGFHTVIHNEEQLKILEKTHLLKPLNVWLKVDTGMHRLGFQPDKVKQAYQRLQNSDKVNLSIRMMTHFADADDVESAKTERQIACFTKVMEGLEAEFSMANSSAILNAPKAQYGFVRPGILLYGASPLADPAVTGADLGVKPVMTLKSRLITMHDLQKGEAVGYGSTWTCPEAMRVGIVAIGYGDGYPRGTKSGAPVLVGGTICPLIGRVAMDMITVDLRKHPNPKIGDSVTLWGRGLPVEKLAPFANTIPYELFCRMTRRVRYQYHEVLN